MRKGRRGFVSLVSLVLGAVVLSGFDGAARADGDAVRGKRIFKKCAVCHSLKPGKIKIGPPLHGVFDREAGSVKRFRYSKAMKSADIVWSRETLDRYLAAPKKFVPGNRMPFPGLKDAGERAGLIAYLERAARGE